jgi:hypothetical protein
MNKIQKLNCFIVFCKKNYYFYLEMLQFGLSTDSRLYCPNNTNNTYIQKSNGSEEKSILPQMWITTETNIFVYFLWKYELKYFFLSFFFRDHAKQQILKILENISYLKPPEKLLLYLRLPGGYPETGTLFFNIWSFSESRLKVRIQSTSPSPVKTL